MSLNTLDIFASKTSIFFDFDEDFIEKNLNSGLLDTIPNATILAGYIANNQHTQPAVFVSYSLAWNGENLATKESASGSYTGTLNATGNTYMDANIACKTYINNDTTSFLEKNVWPYYPKVEYVTSVYSVNV
jgi:hypothetical protein